jgi:hypothetical protein
VSIPDLELFYAVFADLKLYAVFAVVCFLVWLALQTQQVSKLLGLFFLWKNVILLYA